MSPVRLLILLPSRRPRSGVPLRAVSTEQRDRPNYMEGTKRTRMVLRARRGCLREHEAKHPRPDLGAVGVIEIDIWAVVDGRIVIGEAKKSDRIESSDGREKQRCTVLRALVADVTADEFMMATGYSAWLERSKNNVDRKIGSVTRVRWLTDLR